MSNVPVPSLDDLRFQDLVDAAKRYIPQRCPQWTDHNVSDPGVTLIEACASRVEQLGYRTDQLTDAARASLLRLAGVVPTPPSAARTELTFTLTDPNSTDRTIPQGTTVSTPSSYPGPTITFRTIETLVLPAETATGTVPAVNITTVDEVLGVSDGTPDQRFRPTYQPILQQTTSGTPAVTLTVTTVSSGAPADTWVQDTTFAGSLSADYRFVWDATAGEVVFGPSTPYTYGPYQHGQIPRLGAEVRAGYETCQGTRGNVPAGSLTSWVNTPPATVTNRAAATGGAEPETLDEAVARATARLVPLHRAVSADDHAQVLTRRVPDAARVRTVTVGGSARSALRIGTMADTDQHLQVTVVPRPTGDPGQALPAADLVLTDETKEAIRASEEALRLLGTRVQVTEPVWVPFKVAATIQVWPAVGSLAAVNAEIAARDALYRYFHPVIGGDSGAGWPFGRPVHAGDPYAVLAGLPSTVTVLNVTMTDPNDNPISPPLVLPPDGLPLLTEVQIDSVNSSSIGNTNPSDDTPTQSGLLVNQKSGLAIEVPNSSTAPGARLQQASPQDGANQQWTLTSAGSEAWQITNSNSNLVMSVENASTVYGAYVVQQTLGSGLESQWTASEQGGGYYKLTNVNSGLVLAVFAGYTTPGAPIVQQTYDGRPHQLWRLQPSDKATPRR
ncbi:RICIN domain-containing protein [Kitasatospora sp. NPDC091257]|uniref:RICIN domain-containing protein n=1 Tax=unclassified Kitasatospora TaxID=2633591 RepID=UPI002F9131E3